MIGRSQGPDPANRASSHGSAAVSDEHVDPFTTTVKTTIRRLRAKLGDPPIIETVGEGGYRIRGL
jgi:DNA-binding response OmpR family regulator